MEQRNLKDFMIKMSLYDENLDRLLEISSNASLSLPQLFEYFIEDLTDDSSSTSCLLEDWLYQKSSINQPQEEDFLENVTFNRNQVEIMNLLDLILDQ